MEAYLDGIQTWKKVAVWDLNWIKAPGLDGLVKMKTLRECLEARKYLTCIELREPLSNKLTHFMIYKTKFVVKRVIYCGYNIGELRVALIGEKYHRFLKIKSTVVSYDTCASLEKLAKVANCEAVDAYVDRIRCREFMENMERRLAKIKDYIKYAPGGPVMAEAKVDFQDKAINN